MRGLNTVTDLFFQNKRGRRLDLGARTERGESESFISTSNATSWNLWIFIKWAQSSGPAHLTCTLLVFECLQSVCRMITFTICEYLNAARRRKAQNVKTKPQFHVGGAQSKLPSGVCLPLTHPISPWRNELECRLSSQRVTSGLLRPGGVRSCSHYRLFSSQTASRAPLAACWRPITSRWLLFGNICCF